MSDLSNLRGGLLARNTLLNLLGPALPLVLGIFTIPYIVRGLGVDRFGILTLTWTVVGYMSLFDLGMGRALTQLVAEKVAAGTREDLGSLAWTTLLFMSILGIVLAGIVVGLSGWAIHGVLKVPASLQKETLHTCYFVAITIPFVVSASGLRGILEALQEFGWINAVRVPSGILTYLGPLVVLFFSHSLVPVMAILGIGRLTVWVIYLFACLRLLPELRALTLLHRGLGRVISYSSWISISNIVGPAMVYLDRFFLGALVSVAAVTYYGVPLDMITKLWLVPGAVGGVLFPAFAATFVRHRQRAAMLVDRGLKHLFVMLFPVALVIVAFAREGLSLWLGTDFARHSAQVLQWLSVAVFFNSLDCVPFALLQGSGRPDLVAKWNLAELLPYLAVAYLVIPRYGAEGAAIAFAVRTIADTVFLFIAAGRLLPESRESLASMMPLFGISLGTFAIAALLSSLQLRLIFVSLVLLVFLPTAWLAILKANERAYVQLRLNPVNRLFPLLRGKT